ncbi:hypothetical protein OG756_41880 (plasmid) [Streptomyces sp. NBC_01310]|uniref:hypothetical protein n=1 Tax=Streptomyces sp. NBC_01310 TaxID=2903820 RepID=UPI0035B61B1B|nr:hypothetical protein OG756_41880 [Streptomyces sp. NBC_01310]
MTGKIPKEQVSRESLPALLFSDEASATATPLPAPRRPGERRTPLETLTWQAPPTPYEEQ